MFPFASSTQDVSEVARFAVEACTTFWSDPRSRARQLTAIAALEQLNNAVAAAKEEFQVTYRSASTTRSVVGRVQLMHTALFVKIAQDVEEIIFLGNLVSLVPTSRVYQEVA